jgi:formylmethanofuran--tetrahydromethanopterin N-formyltransferase
MNEVEIVETFAEAFKMYASRVLVTAINEEWAINSASTVAGFGTSVIMCGCEAGIEGVTMDTPDGRPGVNILLFANSAKDLGDQLMRRIGQCVMTSPTSACFNNLLGGEGVCSGRTAPVFWRWVPNLKTAESHFRVSQRTTILEDPRDGRRISVRRNLPGCQGSGRG